MSKGGGVSERTAELVHYVVRAVCEKYGILFGPAWSSLSAEARRMFISELTSQLKDPKTEYTLRDSDHEILADHYIPALVHALDEGMKVICQMDEKRAKIKQRKIQELSEKAGLRGKEL